MKAGILIALLLVAVGSASAAKPSYSCEVTTEAAADPAYIALHVTGTVPNKTVPYLRIDGSQEWTALHNQRGLIDDWTTRTTAELPAGTTHTAEILDYRASPADAVVIATCTFAT